MNEEALLARARLLTQEELEISRRVVQHTGGAKVRAFATRAAAGLAIHPATGEQWASVTERDSLASSRRKARRRRAVAKDGALLVSDDTGDCIWRVSYIGKSKLP